MKTIEDVKNFWENYPLFDGESKFEIGSKEFFEEHKRVCLEDGFAGNFKEKLFIPPNLQRDDKILDLGCGIGFWTVEFALRGHNSVYASDLTQKALELTRKRLNLYGLKADLSIQNAERMTYEDEFFDHVNCQGVIHHTPDTGAAIREIARVLKKNGTAYISVYYKNIFVRNWSRISSMGRILYRLGAGLKGRSRESIFLQTNPNEIIRLYDGDKNPIGKCYTKGEIIKILELYFRIEKSFFNFFPARVFPVKLPKFLHRFLSHNFGFLIHLNLRRK